MVLGCIATESYCYQAACFVTHSNSAFIHSRPVTTTALFHTFLPSFWTESPPRTRQRKLSQLQFARPSNNDEDEKNSIGEQLYNGLFRDSSAVLYPILLGTLALTVLPLTTSILAGGLYVLYSFFGLTVVLEDYYDEQRENDMDDDLDYNEAPPVNFVAFVAALLTAGILTPLGASDQGKSMISSNSVIVNGGGDGNAPLLLLGAIGIGAAASWVLQEKSTKRKGTGEFTADELLDKRDAEKRLMQLWDEQLENNPDDDVSKK
jgi:hypothetical protein